MIEGQGALVRRILGIPGSRWSDREMGAIEGKNKSERLSLASPAVQELHSLTGEERSHVMLRWNE